jgi:hypothetical protein
MREIFTRKTLCTKRNNARETALFFPIEQQFVRLFFPTKYLLSCPYHDT